MQLSLRFDELDLSVAREFDESDLGGLMGFYDAGFTEGGFEIGVRDALSAVLASPHFLYRAESGRILATLIRLLGDFDLAEDVMQDAFAAALQRWPRRWLTWK